MPKADIHPTYYPNATVACSCGSTYVIGGTKESQKVEICGNCHPFYSGNQKLIDTAGRVDRFREKMAAAQAYVGKNTKKAEVAEVAPAQEEKAEESVEAPADDVEQPTEEGGKEE